MKFNIPSNVDLESEDAIKKIVLQMKEAARNNSHAKNKLMSSKKRVDSLNNAFDAKYHRKSPALPNGDSFGISNKLDVKKTTSSRRNRRIPTRIHHNIETNVEADDVSDLSIDSNYHHICTQDEAKKCDNIDDLDIAPNHFFVGGKDVHFYLKQLRTVYRSTDLPIKPTSSSQNIKAMRRRCPVEDEKKDEEEYYRDPTASSGALTHHESLDIMRRENDRDYKRLQEKLKKLEKYHTLVQMI